MLSTVDTVTFTKDLHRAKIKMLSRPTPKTKNFDNMSTCLILIYLAQILSSSKHSRTTTALGFLQLLDLGL